MKRLTKDTKSKRPRETRQKVCTLWVTTETWKYDDKKTGKGQDERTGQEVQKAEFIVKGSFQTNSFWIDSSWGFFQVGVNATT